MAKKRRIDPLEQLATSVLAGETTEFPWAILRSTYFTAKWDRAAARDIAQWADRYRIRVSKEQHSAGPNTSGAEWIRFSLIALPPDDLT